MNKPTEKLKEIVECSTVFTLIDDEYKNFSLDSIIKELQNCKEEGFDNLSYIISGNDYYGYNLEVRAIKRREETDEEFQDRLNQWEKLQQEKKQAKKQQNQERLEREKTEYERLKKKFEK
jgi:hypothetical protein